MIKKVVSLFVVCSALAVAWFLVRDDSPRVRVVGIVLFTTNNVETVDGFKEGMAALGWVEGVSVRYVYPEAASDARTLAENVREVLAAKPDLLFASPTPAAMASRKAAAPLGIPVIFAPVNNPVAAGLVENLARPEANVTGVGLAPSEGRRLQSLVSLRPGMRVVSVPYNPADVSAQASLEQLGRCSKELGVSIKPVPMREHDTPEDLDTIIPADADAVFLPRDAMVMSHYKTFNDLAVRRRIPMSTPRLDQVEDGVLTGYGFIGREIGRQSASMAHQVLMGTNVSNVPVETARDFLFLNLGTAQAIGLDVPDSILRQTHYVFRPEEPQQ